MSKISSKTIGILSKAADKAVDKLLSNVAGIKGVILRTADGPVISMILNGANDKIGDKIPDSFNPLIDQFAADLESGDFTGAEQQLADFLAANVKSPLVDGTPEENKMFLQVIQAVVAIIKGL